MNTKPCDWYSIIYINTRYRRSIMSCYKAAIYSLILMFSEQVNELPNTTPVKHYVYSLRYCTTIQ